MFVERVTEVTVNEQEDTSEKLIKKLLFRERVSKRCSSDVAVIRDMDEIVITSSRNSFLNADEMSKRWATTELCIIQRIRRGRFLEEWSLRSESGRSHQYIGL